MFFMDNTGHEEFADPNFQGIEEMTGKKMPQSFGLFVTPDGYETQREAQRMQIRRDVLSERVGVFLICLGTLLSGYAAMVARLLSSAG